LFAEDKSAFFNTSEHAVAGLYNGVTTVNGILTIEYAEVFQGDQVGVDSGRPVFRYDPADIASPTTGVAFTADGNSYTVRGIELDQGISKLILEAV